MNAPERKEFLRRALLYLWAMATVFLVFLVTLLIYELVEAGRHPLPAPDQAAARRPSVASAEQHFTRQVPLYFADAEGRGLVPETRGLELGSSTQDNCRKVLEALIEGPAQGLTPIIPSSLEVHGVYLVGEELVIDLSQELKTDPKRPQSLSSEALMVYGIVNTLAQRTIRASDGGVVGRVRVLFEGSPLDDSFPEHLDLTRPIEPDPRWVLQTAEAVRRDQ